MARWPGREVSKHWGRPRHQTVLGLRLDGELAWSFLVREPFTPLSLFVWEIITSLLHPGVFVKHKIQGPCAPPADYGGKTKEKDFTTEARRNTEKDKASLFAPAAWR